MAGCAAIALSPLLYDRAAIGQGYLGEVMVACAAYVTLGWLIISGKAIMVDLREVAAADFCVRGAKQTGKDRALSALDWAPAA